MIQKRIVKIILILLSFPLFLAACSGEATLEPTPILPPPNVSAGGADSGAEGVIDASNEPLLETSPTPTLLAATPTLVPTPTILPPTVPAPVTDPAVQTIASGQMPPSSRDLLFLADGALRRWNYTTQAVETLVAGAQPSSRISTQENVIEDFVGDITQYSVNGDGKRAVFARLTASQPITRTDISNGETYEYADVDRRYELYFMDLVSRETWLLLPQVDNVANLALSPDANAVAFAGSSLNGSNPCTDLGCPLMSIFFLQTGGGNAGAIKNVAQCNRFCSQIAWHPENNLFAFGDNSALWMQNLAASAPEVLLENRPFDPNSGAGLADLAVYSPIAWARNGRFLSLWRGGWEGGNRAVFDVVTKAVVDVPDTFTYVESFPVEMMWMPDDRLYLLRTETQSSGFRPTIELWRFQPEQNTVVLEESKILSDQQVGAKGQQYLENGRFAYALMSDQNLNPASGLFHLTSLTEVPERVNAVPTVPFYPGGTGDVSWPTDGSGALIAMSDGSGRVYYGPASGGALYDVTAMFGTEPHAFHWQPEG